MAQDFILLRLNPFELRVECKGWRFERSVSYLRVCLSAEGAKNFSWPWLSPPQGWGSLTLSFTGQLLYLWLSILSCYGSMSVTLGLKMRDGYLSSLCHSCRFPCWQSVLKTFPDPGYLPDKDGVA